MACQASDAAAHATVQDLTVRLKAADHGRSRALDKLGMQLR
jgi:hypothetical protein